jgi:PAS domain-containing protein
MAKALLSGLAETEMCVTKMRKDAETKVDILLSTIPHGVVIVNKDLDIKECNKRFITIFEDYPEEFLDAEGLRSFRGYPVSAFVPFADKFREQFYMSKPQQYRFRHDNKIYRVVFFLDDSKSLLGAMFEDITTPSVRREAVIEKAEEVIRKSMTSVQQIAALLGDNAAETEIMLNSIIEEFNVNNSEAGEDGLMAEGSSEG